MPSKKLDLGLSDDEAADGLNVNADYAENYEKWRRKEEMQKMKDKYGADGLDALDESDADSESSEEPLTWSAEDERNFFRTLGALKAKNPKIYDSKTHFFEHADAKQASTADAAGSSKSTADDRKAKKREKREKEPKMTLRDYEERLVTERGGRFDEDDEEEADGAEECRLQSDPSYSEQQARLKEDLKRALNGFSADPKDEEEEEEEEEDGLLKKRVKSAAEEAREEEDYVQWLKGVRNEDGGEMDEDLRDLKQTWTDGRLDEGERFLRDYLLNKRYDTDANPAQTTGLPTYDEIVREDEEEAKQTEFEFKYNFRFEDPDQDFIKQFPRTIKESVRKTDTTRKDARDRRKERKEEEKRQRKEEIKHLKSMKRAEIEEKLRKLREVTGDESLPLSVEDLQKDFDPQEYDNRMKNVFTNDYYEKGQEDEEKPVFSDMSDYGEEDEQEGGEDEVEDEVDGAEQADGDEEDGEEEEEEVVKSNGKKNGGNQAARQRSQKRNSRFMEMIRRKKPEFDPQQKSFSEYLNEYYALDYEDIIADNLRTKFRYRRVEPNSFGLTTDEILGLDDAQLNAWVSVKKVTAYKSPDEDRLDRMVYERKAANPERKRKVFDSVTPKIKKKKPAAAAEGALEEPKAAPQAPLLTGKRKKRLRKKPSAMDLDSKRLHAYGVSVPKLKTALHGRKKRRRAGKNGDAAAAE